MHDQREMEEGEWNKMRKDLDLTNPPLATVLTIEWLVYILSTIVMTTAYSHYILKWNCLHHVM